MLLDTYKLELETRMVAEKKRQQENQDNGQETYKISKDSINNLMNYIDVPKRPPSLFILYKRTNKNILL